VLTEASSRMADIAKRRKLEEQVIHMERQSASTELAAGISHNLNNMLTVELARPRWMDDSEAQGISIHVQTELGEIPPVQGNLGELSEVILNLLLNGVDALAEGGTVTVSTQQSADGFVSMSVTDTGIGMSD